MATDAQWFRYLDRDYRQSDDYPCDECGKVHDEDEPCEDLEEDCE